MPKDILKQTLQRYPQLASMEEVLMQAYATWMDCFQNGGKLLLCGNGGSAADSEHISGELLKGFGQRRPLTQEWQEKLGPELANELQGSLPAIPLSSFTALSTAYANDCNPDYVFAQLVFGLGNPGDVLFSISTSGNSKNVAFATEVANKKGLKTVGLTGESGGKLKSLCDLCLCVPEKETFKIQELHLPIYHALCLMVEKALF